MTDSPRFTIRRHSDITTRRSSNVARIFPCPSSNFPSRRLFRTGSGRFSSRSVFATADRLFPTRAATCSWFSPNSSISRRYASAASIGLISSRWRFSTSASSSISPSLASRITAGTRVSPAIAAARSLRSPAITW